MHVIHLAVLESVCPTRDEFARVWYQCAGGGNKVLLRDDKLLTSINGATSPRWPVMIASLASQEGSLPRSRQLNLDTRLPKHRG